MPTVPAYSSGVAEEASSIYPGDTSTSQALADPEQSAYKLLMKGHINSYLCQKNVAAHSKQHCSAS